MTFSLIGFIHCQIFDEEMQYKYTPTPLLFFFLIYINYINSPMKFLRKDGAEKPNNFKLI
jgi:hypothetical protein